MLDKIHQPSEQNDEETSKDEEKTKLALSVPKIVGICLLIVLVFIGKIIGIYKFIGGRKI